MYVYNLLSWNETQIYSDMDQKIIFLNFLFFWRFKSINPLASPSAEAPALKYGDVNTETTSPGEVKGLIKKWIKKYQNIIMY